MLERSQMHPYQVTGVDHILEHNQSMLWQEMGLGKTVTTLTAINDLFDTLAIRSVLVVAPLRVCQTVWRQEALKWRHTQWLRFSLITGNADKRSRAIRARANVYLVNYDNLTWLQRYIETAYLKRGLYPPFDMVVYDEISKLKNARTRQGTERGKSALKMLPFIPRRVGLTGTPSSNGIEDLFGQYLVMDGGARLGTSFTDYQQNFFIGVNGSRYKLRPGYGAVDAIKALIGDITISMRAKDYLEMPPIVTNDIVLDLPDNLQQTYDEIETEMMVQLQSGAQLEVFNQGSLINRTLQYAAGAMYTTPGMPDWETIHDIKLDALEDIVEEAAGEPILLAYQFQHDAHKIMKRFPDAVWFSSKMSEKEAIKAITDFQEGNIRLLIGHPASMGHGLDRLQESGNIVVWYGLNWALDLYDQTIARLWRQGQKRRVVVHRLLMRNTTDFAVLESLRTKAADEMSIKQAVMSYWQSKRAA